MGSAPRARTRLSVPSPSSALVPMLRPAWGWGQCSSSGIRRERGGSRISRLAGCTTSKGSRHPAAYGGWWGEEGGQHGELILVLKKGWDNLSPLVSVISCSHSGLCLKQNQPLVLLFLKYVLCLRGGRICSVTVHEANTSAQHCKL